MDCVFAGYDVLPDGGVRLRFNIPDPDPGFADTVSIRVDDTDLPSSITNAQLRALVIAKLRRTLRREGFAAKLNPFLGQSITV